MENIMNIVKSLVKINDWKVLRLDIQHYSHKFDISGFVGYLTYRDKDGVKKEIRIHDNGEFEIND